MKTRLGLMGVILLTLGCLMRPGMADAAPPAAPQNLQYSWLDPLGVIPPYWNPGPEALLRWDPVPGADSYTVYQVTEPGGTLTAVATGLTTPSWRDVAPDPGPVRHVVAGVNVDGTGPVSAEVIVQEAGFEFVSSIQSLPSINNDQDITATNAWLAWIVNVMEGVDGFVELATDAIHFTPVYLNTNYSPFHSMILSNLEPGTVYWYRVSTAGSNRGGWTLTNWFVTDVIPHPPVAYPSVVGAVSNAGPVTIQLEATDPDTWGPPLVYSVVVWPTNGTLSAIYGNEPMGPRLVDYYPFPGARGADYFEFVVQDEQFTSEPAPVTLPVVWLNRPPVIESYATNTLEDASHLAVPVTATDEDGDPVTITLLSSAHGAVTGVAPQFVYQPPLNFSGLDILWFRADDGQPGGVTQGFVQVAVETVNDAPVALGQSVGTAYNTAVGFVLAGVDVENDPLSYTVVSLPAGGTVSGTLPNLTFSPTIGWTGTASLVFRVNDGLLDSAPAAVSISVAGPGTVPAAPTGLQAAALSRTQIRLNWTDVAGNEDGFRIERSANGSTWTQVGVVGPNVGTYTSAGLSANKVYYHRVRAHNVLGNSPYSNTASARTLK